MKKIINGIINFLKSAEKVVKSRIFTYAIIGVLILSVAHMCNKKDQAEIEREKAKQNTEALKDTVHNYRTKTGELEARTTALIADKKELKNLNEDLRNEIDKTEGKVSSLTKANIKLSQSNKKLKDLADSLYKKLGEVRRNPNDTNQYQFTWELKYKYDEGNYDILHGKSILRRTQYNPLKLKQEDTYLTYRETSIDLVWGQKEIKGKGLQVFIRSPYPGFEATDMEGILIDPRTNPIIQKYIEKDNGWFTGWSIGIGVTPFYNINTGDVDIAIGPTIGYTIFEF